jgi:predicted Zn-dependent protease
MELPSMGERTWLVMRFGVVCLLLVWCSACASYLPPLGAAGQWSALEPDEALLWDQAAREHRLLSRSSSVLRDPLLEDYLASIARRLLPAELATGGLAVAVHVLINPSLNAFAYPTGAIYLHSGLLAQLENEAQVAAVLAHEIGHVVHRHAIRHLREERNKDLWRRVAIVATPLVLGPLLAPLGVSVSGGVNPAVLFQRPSVQEILHHGALDTSLALAARPATTGRFDPTTSLYTRARPPLALLDSVRPYSPALVAEADRFALDALARAGYDPRALARSLARLHGAAAAHAEQEPFWWGQPSTHEARRRWVEEMLASRPPVRAAGPPPSDLYQQHARLLVRENAIVALKAGRVDEAIAQLGRALRLQPQDAVAHFHLGQAYAAKATEPEELHAAVQAYSHATRLEPRYAEAYRELASLYTRLGDAAGAAQALKAYTSLRHELADEQRASLRIWLSPTTAGSQATAGSRAGDDRVQR